MATFFLPRLRTAGLVAQRFSSSPSTALASPRIALASPCIALRSVSPCPRPSLLQALRCVSTQPLHSTTPRRSAAINATPAIEPAASAHDAAPPASTHAAAPPASTHAAAPPASTHSTATTSKSVAYWLLASAASVFGIVVFGGLTRLTESGLSITEWKPVTGTLWPASPEAWEDEYTKYKSSPEFAMLNSSMTLPEFKQIYFMEWAHRLWGRVIGVSFLVPTVYFIARKRVTPRTAAKLVAICALIGTQGAIGWWMVKSGLKDDLFEPGSHPRVSQYRLAAHLGTAFLVYCSMLHTGLTILKEHRILANPAAAQSSLAALQSPALRLFRRSVVGLTLLVFTTAMSGALVAGLDAGLIYNEFPWMGLGLTPPKKELFDPWYSHVPDQSDLYWRNALENPSLVQLDHRILATTTFTAIMGLLAYTRLSKRVRTTIPKDVNKGVWGMVHLVSLQVTLGISTLIYMVPTWLASAHQAGALALLTGAVVLYSRISLPRAAIMKQVMSRTKTHTPHISARLRR